MKETCFEPIIFYNLHKVLGFIGEAWSMQTGKEGRFKNQVKSFILYFFKA